MRVFNIILVILFSVLIFSESFGQLPWTKDPSNPVLSGGADGTWNRHLYWPSVLYNPDSARYEMWYSGSAGSLNRPMNIGFATSPDGVNWTHHGPAVLKPDAGTWDESSVEGAWVILEDGTYKMWYAGSNSVNTKWSIGYASSSDGINWTKYPSNPVMTQGPVAWEAGGVTVGSVLYNEDSSRYEMWYGGYTAAGIGHIGYATSADGVEWTKHPSNPVLTNGSSGTWDEDVDEVPRVLYLNNVYHMWFVGIPYSYSNPWQIGWATSVDGITWYKYNDTSTTIQFYTKSDPILKPDDGQWDGSRLQAGTVIREGDTLHIWYTGVLNTSGENLWRIGHATAPYESGVTGLSEILDLAAPDVYNLFQNYPNPFNPKTVISWQLAVSSEVELSIFNLLGQKVKTLVSERLPPGYYEVEFNGQNLSSGVYLYKIKAGEWQEVKKMVLLK